MDGLKMDKYEQNKVILYLTAVYNDLETYLKNPHEFEAEYFEDLREAVQESLNILEKA
jgi:hypothetical protein